jgi:glyoxylase-like metal-dependent hydrolase (beta-lactamase superfamily II)
MPEITHLLTGFHVNTDQGNLGFCTIALLRGRTNILVDVGHQGRANQLAAALERANMPREDIHGVVLTHAHWDHCQNTDMFPNAKIMIHPKELEYARDPKRPDLATARYFLNTLDGRDVEEVVEGAEIEPGVRILETPGHTKGHISVLADTPQGQVAISGDALPWANSVVTGQPMIIFWDEKEAAESVRKLLDSSRIFYPGHDRAFRLGEGNAVEYFSGEDSLRIMLSHDGVGDMTLRVAPDGTMAPTIIG